MRVGLSLLNQSRRLGTVASAKRADVSGSGQLQVHRLSNGLTVAVLPTDGQVFRVAATYRAGSRYENHESLGASHVLRRVAGQASDNHTAVSITRNLDQIGANFDVTSDRETISYTLEGPKQWLKQSSEFFTDAVSKQLLLPWDIKSSISNWVQRDTELLRRLNDTSFLMENLHAASFRGGLNNSMYMSTYKLKYGGIGQEVLQRYVNEHFSIDRAVLVGVGVTLDEIIEIADQFQFSNSGKPLSEDKASVNRSGEVRIENYKEVTQAALVVPGVAEGDSDAVSLSLLSRVIGPQLSVKWGSSATSLVNNAAQKAAQNPVFASAMNLSYSDAGIFGLYVVGHHSDVGPALKAAQKVVATVGKEGVSKEALARAKKQMGAEVAMACESQRGFVNDVSHQLLFTDAVASPQEKVDKIASITAEQVNQVAKKIVAGKPSMAAIGNLDGVPFLDELAA